VNVPCPISAGGETSVIVPSVAIETHKFTGSGVSAAALPMSNEGSARIVSVKVRPAVVSLRKSRRLTFAAVVMA